MLLSQGITLFLGFTAILIAWKVSDVLELMLHSYSFMVSGLFTPVIAGIFLKHPNNNGAFWLMIAGGTTPLLLILSGIEMPFGLDANIYGITLAAFIYFFFHFFGKRMPVVLQPAS